MNIKIKKNGKLLSYTEFCKVNRFVAISQVNRLGAKVLINNKGKKVVDYVFGDLRQAITDWKEKGYSIMRI